MGGDLHHAPAGKSPTFLVAALEDPRSGNLDRYQIVKGWMDANGELQVRPGSKAAENFARSGPLGTPEMPIPTWKRRSRTVLLRLDPVVGRVARTDPTPS
jgi:hypothetical protein